MLVPFFMQLRSAGVPVSLSEWLVLLEALKAQVAGASVRDFYHLSRAALVKDERHYDRFDRVFAQTFEGAEQRFEEWVRQLPEDWVTALTRKAFSDEELAALQSRGSWDELLERLRKTLEEQTERHAGGSRWVGTAGTSPFGNGGAAAQGVRIAGASGQRRAFKVWEAREYRALDDSVELGTRNMKVALRKLRRLAREGAAEQLDLDDTIRATARNGGHLDLRLVPERRNALRVLLLLDIGGSMDDHVRICEELFSAARSELKHLKCFYFHNFIYERLWQDSRRPQTTKIPTAEVLRTYGREYRVILVGDATMSPYEIVQPGGSIEHWNPESGATWMQRLVQAYPHLVWLNPQRREHWEHIESAGITRELVGGRMFPLTLEGIDKAIRELRRPAALRGPPLTNPPGAPVGGWT